MTKKIIIATDGVTAADCGELKGWLSQRESSGELNPEGKPHSYQLQNDKEPGPLDWEFIDWPESIYFQKSISNMISKVSSEYVMILPPWIEIQDRRWFGKLQMPFTVDPHTMLVAFPVPGLPSAALPPVRFPFRKHPDSEALLTKINVFKDIVPRMGKVKSVAEWMKEFSRLAEERGGMRWLAQSLRYFAIKHEPHFPGDKECLQPENLKTQIENSESRSQTTPSSSTPTIIETGGSGVSVPF